MARKHAGRVKGTRASGTPAQMPKHGEHYGYPVAANHMRERHKSMISDDRSAPSNLPRHVMESYWPQSHNYHVGYVDDLFHGVHNQLREDYDDFGKVMSPKKY